MSEYFDSEYDNGSQFNLKCTNFTVDDLKFLNRLRNVTAFMCSLLSLVILIFLVYSKAFSSLLKRLYFYLVVGTLFTEIFLGLNIEHQWHYKNQEAVCVWLGFFTQFTCVMVLILSYEIVLHLLCLVVSQIRASSPFPRCTRPGSKHCTVILEIAYIFIPLSIATVFAIIPYINKDYGIAGPWCWVQSLNEHCEPAGLMAQMSFYGLYMAVGSVGIAVSVLYILIYCKIVTSFRDARYLLKRTLYVMLFQTFHIVIVSFNFTVRAYTLLSRRHQIYGIWLADAFTLPIGVLIFPLGYIFCLYPIKDIFLRVFKSIAHKCCLRNNDIMLQQHNDITINATAPESDRISQPSSTFFVVPHSDDFDDEKSPLLVKNTGRRK